MFILIYLLTFLTALCQAQSFGYDQKPQYSPKPPTYNKQRQPSNYNQGQGERNINYKQRNYTKPKQEPMGDAVMLMKSRINDKQRMKERDMFMRRRDADNREGRMPAWSVPRAKGRLYTGTNMPTNTEVPAWSMKWSKYYDMPVNNRAGSTNAVTGMKMPGMRWPKDMDSFSFNGARVTKDNPSIKLQVSSARRSYNQDIPHFGKSTEMPAWSKNLSKYYDIPLKNRAGYINVDTGMEMPGMRWLKDIDPSPGNGAIVTMDNPGLKLQVSSAQRSYNQDIPHFGKSEIPTDELKKTLKNIDEQLTKYENGIYKLFKPNYLHDHPKLEAIKKEDLPIDDKVHTLLKTLKTRRKGTAFVPAEEISDISI